MKAIILPFLSLSRRRTFLANFYSQSPFVNLFLGRQQLRQQSNKAVTTVNDCQWTLSDARIVSDAFILNDARLRSDSACA